MRSQNDSNFKTLIEFDKSILKEYSEWKNANPDNWDINNYLNHYYDINAAIAFSKLFLPDFIIIEECVLLSFNFNKDKFYEWFNELNQDISETEKICNLYEVKDFFMINPSQYKTEQEYNYAINVFANALKMSWELNLEKLYPNRNYIVSVFEEYGNTCITLNRKIQ
jgi:hypothetical protein